VFCQLKVLRLGLIKASKEHMETKKEEEVAVSKRKVMIKEEKKKKLLSCIQTYQHNSLKSTIITIPDGSLMLYVTHSCISIYCLEIVLWVSDSLPPPPTAIKEERLCKDVGFIWCPILRIVQPKKLDTKERTLIESKGQQTYTHKWVLQNNNLVVNLSSLA
jgi:hypothetical protein